MNQYYLTEWRALTTATEVTLHLYTVPLKDPSSRNTQGGKLIFHLNKLNNFQPMVFFDQYIASFEEIKQWGDETFLQYEARPISPSRNVERTLLERLLKKQLERLAHPNYMMNRGKFRSKQAHPKATSGLLIYPALDLNVNVSETAEIVFGFDLTHQFEYRENLLQQIKRDPKSVSAGMRVIDSTHPKSYEYEFVEVAPYRANEVSPIMKCSIIDYFAKKDPKRVIAPDALVVHVKDRNNHILPYLPEQLKQSCSFETIPTHQFGAVNRIIKLSPDERMSKLMPEALALIGRLPMLQFERQDVRAARLGYSIQTLPSPRLQFGKGKITSYAKTGLNQGGVFETGKATVSFFVDPKLRDQQKLRQVLEFINKLQTTSERFGVTLNVSNKPKGLSQKLSADLLQAEDVLYQLKSIPQHFEGVVVVIAEEASLQHSYQAIKRQFGGKQDMVTQCVELHDRVLSSEDTLYNILLGIYVKAGLQPWILGEPLHSDCFVGLDVSHENGKHAAGIIQIIGKDGAMIKQKVLSTSEAGEKISSETMREIVYDTLHAFEEQYGHAPKHITFHRDGFGREDLTLIDSILSPREIQFDYVEILKNVNRRMAIHEKGWKTSQGLSYTKERMGYLLSTNPHVRVGMAKPIKVVQQTTTLPFEAILTDVYRLSFMHVHSLLKTRLPITTHYADLSSTFHNRGLLNANTEHEEALPFV